MICIKDLREYEKEKLISEDDREGGEEELQKITDRFIEKINEIGDRKEKEIIEVVALMRLCSERTLSRPEDSHPHRHHHGWQWALGAVHADCRAWQATGPVLKTCAASSKPASSLASNT